MGTLKLDTIKTNDTTLAAALLCEPDCTRAGVEILGDDRHGQPELEWTLGHPVPGRLLELKEEHDSTPGGLMVPAKKYEHVKGSIIMADIRQARDGRMGGRVR